MTPNPPRAAVPAQPDAPHEVLRAYAEGRINHLNAGLCPDVLTGPNSRDPECRVCHALAAQGAAERAVPAGWVLVPADATDDMMAAFAKAASAEVDWHGATEAERQDVRDGFGPAYRAMLAAAPATQAPQPADPDGEAFRTAARLGLTLRFYGGCAQSSMPGTPSAYEVVSGADRAEAMREAVQRAAAVIAAGGEAQRLAQPAPGVESNMTGGPYAPLPNFDDGVEPIWNAIFNWKTAERGADALQKAMKVESAIADQLRAYADATHALRASHAQAPAGETPDVFGLKWPGEDRINLSMVFDTEAEAAEYLENRCDTPGILVVRLTAQPALTAQAAPAPTHEQIAAYLEATGAYVTNDASREAAIANAVAAHKAQAAPAAGAVAGPTEADTVDLVGVRANGEHVNLGKIAMPPRMKAREIAASQFGGFQDEDGSDAEMCFGAMEELLAWMTKQGWAAIPAVIPAAAPTPAAQADSVPVHELDDDECRCEPSDYVRPADYDGDGSVAGMARRAARAQADSGVQEDAALLRYALSDGGNQRMNWQDVYDDWNGEGYFRDALMVAMTEDAALAAKGQKQ